jgi:hypothetical protein
VSTKVTLNDKIFTPAFRQALSAVPFKVAKQYQETTRQKMINQSPAGATFEKSSGKGFKRAGRRSARGQRPQPQTQTLANALQSKRTGEFSALVDIAPRRNPENGQSARVYGERLETKMDRVIFSDKGDLRQAETIQKYEVEKVIKGSL